MVIAIHDKKIAFNKSIFVFQNIGLIARIGSQPSSYFYFNSAYCCTLLLLLCNCTNSYILLPTFIYMHLKILAAKYVVNCDFVTKVLGLHPFMCSYFISKIAFIGTAAIVLLKWKCASWRFGIILSEVKIGKA